MPESGMQQQLLLHAPQATAALHQQQCSSSSTASKTGRRRNTLITLRAKTDASARGAEPVGLAYREQQCSINRGPDVAAS